MTDAHSTIGVIGLGAMGRTLARAFLGRGHATTVWNRSPGRADELVALGATVAEHPGPLIASSSFTVICVLDHDAVGAVLDGANGAVSDRTLVNLTSSTPDQARGLAARVTRAGGRYLDGSIMVPTPVIGTDGGLVLYGGDRSVYDDDVETLHALGPDADYLGADPGLAAVYDLAMLDVFFNGMTSFLHAVALVEAEGVTATAFLPYATRILDVLDGTFPGLAADVERSDYHGDEDNIAMELRAIEHVVEVSAARGIDTTVPAVPRAVMAAAVAAGHGRDGFSRVVELLRARR
jgi:3-hydroxyisobutyrate dehydrogenase-like beta-hydroxyacid dehydrogenase